MNNNESNQQPPKLIPKQLVIAIDGFSSCGKSTLAKDLAKILNYTFLDSGAMYRAISLYFLENQITPQTSKDYSDELNKNVSITFTSSGNARHTVLNDKDVETEIRAPRIAEIVSEVAANSSVRKFLVSQQRLMGKNKGVIMDGRDIGTVVFPDADIKFFVTADIDIRASRRYNEMMQKGIDTTLDKVKQNLEKRDKIDSSRKDSPLKKAADAIVIDTSFHTRESQVEEAMEHILTVFK